MVLLRAARIDEFSRFTAFETDPGAAPSVNTDSPEKHARRHARDDATYLAIEEAGELVGFVLLVLDSDGASVELRRIVVARPGEGIGQGALAQVVRYCERSFDRTRLWLDVAKSNARGRHVYAKLGFVAFAEAPPNAEPDLEYLERPLRPER